MTGTVRVKQGSSVDPQAVTNRMLSQIDTAIRQLVQAQAQQNAILQNIYGVLNRMQMGRR